MKALEDLGFYCIDNLPPNLVPQTLSLLRKAGLPQVALTLDTRSGLFGDATQAISAAARDDTVMETIFLEARDDVLVRRYSETRRRHPLLGAKSLPDAIAHERARLGPLRALASTVIDTSGLTQAELKERLAAATGEREPSGNLVVTITSFGFKHGVPSDLDLLFDVRFLRNPNYVPELQPLTGADPAVAKYIEADASTAPFLDRLFGMIDFLLPRYVAEGKAQLTIGIGCTGGRHRSVYVARRLHEHIRRHAAVDIRLDTRDQGA